MPDATNGVSPADSAALAEVIEGACALLAAHDPVAVYDVVKALELAIGTSWSEIGTTMTYLAPAQLFADAESFAAQLAARTREARIAAFPALAALDEAQAAPLFARTLELDLSRSHQVSFEANLFRALWARWKPLAAYLPRPTLGRLFVQGRFELKSLTDEQVAAIPEGELLEALFADRLPYPDHGDGARLMSLHPAFADLDARGALAERLAGLRGHFARDLFPPVIASLIAARHPSAERAALTFFERMGPRYGYALGLVIAAGHRPTLERLFAELPRHAGREDLRWDPHHTDPDLAPAIRAGYALDPSASSERFGAYFEPGVLGTDRGCKVASDIWMIGAGKQVDHGGTRLGTGDGPVVAQDRRWAPIAARLAHHPRLGRTARWVVSVTAERPRVLIAETALPEETWREGGAKKSARKSPAKKKTAVAKKRK